MHIQLSIELKNRSQSATMLDLGGSSARSSSSEALGVPISSAGPSSEAGRLDETILFAPFSRSFLWWRKKFLTSAMSASSVCQCSCPMYMDFPISESTLRTPREFARPSSTSLPSSPASVLADGVLSAHDLPLEEVWVGGAVGT